MDIGSDVLLLKGAMMLLRFFTMSCLDLRYLYTLLLWTDGVVVLDIGQLMILWPLSSLNIIV